MEHEVKTNFGRGGFFLTAGQMIGVDALRKEFTGEEVKEFVERGWLGEAMSKAAKAGEAETDETQDEGEDTPEVAPSAKGKKGKKN